MKIEGNPGEPFRAVLARAIGDDWAVKVRIAEAVGKTPEAVQMALTRQRRSGGMAGMDEDALREWAAAAGYEPQLTLVPKRKNA